MKKLAYFILSTLFIFILNNCNTASNKKENITSNKQITRDSLVPLIDSVISVEDTINQLKEIKAETCAWDIYLSEEGLINIQDLDSTILVDLKYSSEDNFMHRDVYGCLNKCYLQIDVAERLVQCQNYLTEKDSSLTLLIYDGVRPRSVQQYMWDLLDMPINEKTKFVSNPKKGSLHNFGAALDITLAYKDTKEALDMGAEYDQIGILAWPIKEKQMLDSCLLTLEQVNNRKLLRRVMKEGRFFNIQTEWWHFNACYRDSAYIKYKIIEGFVDSSLTELR